MPIIDADGYFGGDRFDAMSDMARAMWPTFFLASNTVARIELNYRKVCAEAFSRWKKNPTEAQFWAWVQEYQDAYLLFVYEAEGSVWGQWDTSEKFLPRHKMSADLRTPAPSVREFIDWKDKYIEIKAAKSNHSTNFKIMRTCAKDSAPVRTNVRGVGVGVGVGGGNNTVAKAATGAHSLTAEKDIWFDSEFWPAWPVKQNRTAAKEAARKLKSEEYPLVMAGVRAQSARIAAMERPIHASTWLNKRRWEDEVQLSMITNGNGRVLPEYKPGREVPRYERPVD